MKASIENQNLISTSPLSPADENTLAQNPPDPADFPVLNENRGVPDFILPDEQKPTPENLSTHAAQKEFPEPLPLDSEGMNHDANSQLTQYEVKHIVAGEIEPEDDVWTKQKQRTNAFLNGLNAAKKWAPILTGDTTQLPGNIQAKLYDPHVPAEVQEDDVKGDIMKEWYAEHFTNSGASPEEMEKMWPEYREALAESLDTPPDHSSLYQAASQKNKGYTQTLKELEKQFLNVEKIAHRTFSSPVEEDQFRVSEDSLGSVPEEIRPQVKQALTAHHQEETQRVKRLKPLYDEMRQAIKHMASFEEVKTVPLSMGNKAGGYQEINIPLMINIPELIKEFPSLSATGMRLRQLSPEDRLLLFSQVEQDITAEQKQNKAEEKGVLSELGHAVSRSHMKGIYGVANLSNAFNALSKDLASEVLDKFPDSVFSTTLSTALKELARQDRDTIANVQRMRDLAENRENPLYPLPDEQDNSPKPHWLKQCFLGFAEESVPMALAISCKPALLGWGGTTVGNKYARYEAEAAEKSDYEAVQKGNRQNDSSLAHGNRFLSAMAMGSLQTLLEAGAYGKVFSPLVKSMPKASAAFAIGVRPYIEQKAIGLTEPLGAVSAEYMTRGLEEGKWDTFDSDRMVDALGSADDNTREYLMNLPFILLSTGKVALHHFKSRKTILNDPALASRYKIPQKTINLIKKENNPQTQSLLLQKALRESPVWKNPEVLYSTSDFLNKIEPVPFSGNTVGRYTPGSLAQLLELSPDKVKNYVGTPLPPSQPRQGSPSPFNSGKLTPLEKKQMLWHAKAGLPSISPVIKNNELLWELKSPGKENHFAKGLYKSPDSALIEWQNNQKGLHLHNREQIFSNPLYNFEKTIFKNNTNKELLEKNIQGTLSEIEKVSFSRLLYKSNLHDLSQLGKRSLNSLSKKEQQRTKAHIIEDSMQYASDIPSEEVIANRLTQIWSYELRNKTITSREATEWINQWENIFQKKLPPVSIEHFSPKTLYSHLSRKLARLSMQPNIFTEQNILPPAFMGPTQTTFSQLAAAHQLAQQLPETLFYRSRIKAGENKQTAFYKTLENYIPQPEKITRRHTTRLTVSPAALKNTPPVLNNEFKQDLLWLDEQGLSPLLSISHKGTGQTQWLSVYPNGKVSRLHATPQEALLEWREYGASTNKWDLLELGEKATDSLIDFYYGKDGNKRPDIKLTVHNNIKKTSQTLDRERAKERDSIYDLQNPHVIRGKNTESYIGGENWSEISQTGNINYNIELYKKSDPLCLIEEHAEISWENMIHNNTLSIKNAMDILKKISKETNNTYIPQKLSSKSPHLQYYNIMEGLSQLSREYMMTQHSNPQIPDSLKEWMLHMYASPWKDLHAIPLLRRSTNLDRAIKSGNISPHTLNMLKESVGLNERFNNERKLHFSTKGKRIFPLLKNPRELFDSLPEEARLSVSKQLLSAEMGNTALSSQKSYKRTKQELLELEKNIKQHPELLDWDYDENTKQYTSLKNLKKQEDNPAAITGLSQDSTQKAIRNISILRRSMDNMAFSDIKGIRLGEKVFSEKSSDRPNGMPQSWKVHFDKDSEGLLYAGKDNPGHIVRLSPGFIHDPHNTGKRPYIRHIIDGNYLDAKGNIRSPYSPSTFIPLEKFTCFTPDSPQNNFHQPFKELLNTLSDKKRFHGLLYTPNISEMTTPSELVFQLLELKKKIPLDKNEEKVFNSLFDSACSLRRSPDAPQTDLDALSRSARELKKMLFDDK